MDKTVKFAIPGKPVGKGRPRFFRGHAVTPKETREYEEDVGFFCKLAAPGVKLTGNISVVITAYYPIPKSYTKKARSLIACLMKRPTVKPDLDNVVKVVLDGLTKVGLWSDDSLVVDLRAAKFYDDGRTDDGKGCVDVAVSGQEVEDDEQ